MFQIIVIGAMRVAVGGAATGTFSSSTPLWEDIEKAGILSGDRMWRFPLWECYNKNMTGKSLQDY